MEGSSPQFAALNQHDSDSKSYSIELVEDIEEEQPVKILEHRGQTDPHNRLGLFKWRNPIVPVQKFVLEKPRALNCYAPITTLNRTAIIVDSHPTQRRTDRLVAEVKPATKPVIVHPEPIDVEVPIPKNQKKKQKNNLKNLQRYKRIEDAEVVQKLQQKYIQSRLEKEYKGLLNRGNQNKMSQDEIKVWLSTDKKEKVQVQQTQAISFMDQHVNNYNSLLKVVLSHSYADQLLEPEERKVPAVFGQKQTYQKTFQFLIFNEAIASLHNAFQNYSKTEAAQKPIRVYIKAGCINPQGLMTFFVKQNLKQKDPSEYNILRNLSLSKFNLVMVSKTEVFDPSRYNTRNFQKGNHFMGCLATPENKQQLAADIKLFSCFETKDFAKYRGDEWKEAYIFIFEKISTFVREFLAVRNVRFSDLAEYIYDPPLMNRANPSYVRRPQVFQSFFSRIEGSYNGTQLQSVRELCLRDRGIIMLQGPPGTGKTSTLLGVLAGQYHYIRQMGELARVKILVCTPSNTAVDHIVRRVVNEGLLTTGENHHPRILRTGLVETDDPLIRSVYLDYLCQKQLLASNLQLAQQIKWTIPQIRERITYMLKDIKKMQMSNNEHKQEKLKQMHLKRRELEEMAYQLRRKRVDQKSRYNQIQKRLISEAQIIFTTLSSSGSQRLEIYKGQFACLIVDEAGQCTEPNLLIAMQLNIPKVLLIGDPCQLPATTFSPDSSITLFNRSMFQRMIDAGLRPYFLDIQYRMAPQIREFPSTTFYGGRLKDDPSVIYRPFPQNFKVFLNQNLLFLDVRFGMEKRVDKSYENISEANVVQEILELMKIKYESVGVITPYKQQSRKLQSMLRKYSNVFVNTVDSFQGQEKDIIIISCVRSSTKSTNKSLGFLIDERRINVALTRSKFLLFVVGNADTLGTNEIWHQFLQHVTKRKQYVKLSSTEAYRQTLQRLVSGNLKQYDRICERIITLPSLRTKDIRRAERQEIGLKDFEYETREAQTPIKAEEAQETQPQVQRKQKIVQPVQQSQENKWSIEAAGSTMQRKLEKMFGDKSFFELLGDMK